MTPGADDLWFLPLGGCGEIGMNLNLFGHNGAWLMVDCGITFEAGPGGSNQVQMPDPSFIAAHSQSLVGVIATPAHEDHIGALPNLWPQFRCPVYTTAFTAAVLRNKSAGRGAQAPEPIIEVLPGDERQIGPFSVRWIPITHSTPETMALEIITPAGSVLHTADWKIDTAPIIGEPFNARHFQAVGERGITAVVCDSTNATVSGYTPSEGEVAKGLAGAIAACTGRVVIACFASSVARLQTVSRIGHRTGRRLGLLGRSLQTMVSCARSVDLLGPDFAVIESSHLGYLPPEEVLVLATGSQGEPGAALSRLAADTHPALSLDPVDTVIFSGRTIPGNEAAVGRLSERLAQRGVTVAHADDAEATLHASGHPCAGELRDMYQWLKPGVAVPVHGEQRHMQANAQIARSTGVPLALTGENGDLFYLAPEAGVKRRAAATGRLSLGQDGTLNPVI